MQGAIINGYQLKRLLGRGGMAEVWYAENGIGKPAAVKILNESLSGNQKIVERFHNEALIMVKLNHPNIRQVFDYGYIGHRHCIIMEYLEGNDLEAMLQSGKRFSDADLRRWWNQIADALNYTHAMGVVHRDIKPSNLFLDSKGDIKLLDFGISKIKEGISLTQTGSTIGTLMYMSPVQVKDPKRIDHRTDLYSLAVSFVQLLTGRPPYDSNFSSDFDIQLSIVSKPLDLSMVPEPWRVFLTPYLYKEPTHRPPLKHFEALATPQPQQTVKSPNTVNNVPQSQQSNKGVWIAIVSVLGAGLVTALLVVMFLAKPRSKFHHQMGPISVRGNTEVPSNQIITDGWMTKDILVNANGVSFLMKPVQGGTFQMGSADYGAENDEYPVHNVTVGSFYMCETEVTQALWQAVMGRTVRQQRDSYMSSGPMRGEGPDYPMYYISWNECQDFIIKLNRITGKRFRMPTEAEWEFAARGGNQRSVNKFAGSSAIDNVAWYTNNSNLSTHKVKGKSCNELGLYDMSGNVWEWCSDWYSSDYYSYSPSDNPQCNTGQYRVVRGGSFYSEYAFCRVTKRHKFLPDNRETCYGLRLVMD